VASPPYPDVDAGAVVTRQLAPRGAALALTLALAACGGDSSTEPISAAAAIVGVYPLRTYDGATLPLVIGQNATQGTLELTSGHVTLKDDGSFAEGITYKLTPPGAGAVAVVDSLGSSGRYTASAGQIVFTFPDGERVTATHANGTITVVGQATFVYRR
jgi:hypothetical protein